MCFSSFVSVPHKGVKAEQKLGVAEKESHFGMDCEEVRI